MIYLKKITKLLFILFIFFGINSSLLSATSSDGLDVNLHIGSCNNNGICEAGSEDFFVCPADCTPVVVPPTSSGGAIVGSLVMDNVFNNLRIEVGYDNAVIKWNSFIPTTTNVKWGTSPDYKEGVIKNIDFLLEHRVQINGLESGTIYYFTIEAENLLRKTNSLENQLFRTLSLLDTTPPSNPTNVNIISSSSGITISWDNPPDPDFDYVRIMRNKSRYYGSPYIGNLVYEGDSKYFTDSQVKEGEQYFYSLFSRDRIGNYSSGSLIKTIYNPEGKDNWGSILTPVEEVEPIKEDYIVSQNSSYYYFKTGDVLSLSGDNSINIKTNHSSKTKNDDMWVSIKDQNEVIVGQYFFSRVKDEDGFINVTVPLFRESGYYNIDIYNYTNDSSYLVNSGVFKINKSKINQSNQLSKFTLIIILTLLILLILLLLIIHRLFKRFFKKDS